MTKKESLKSRSELKLHSIIDQLRDDQCERIIKSLDQLEKQTDKEFMLSELEIGKEKLDISLTNKVTLI